MNDKYLKEMLFTQEQIEERCKELGKWVDETFKDTKELVMIGFLKGSVPFMAELMKSVTIPMRTEYMIVSSYAGGVKSTGNLKTVLDLNTDIAGRDVLIVEDIVDTGLTLSRSVEKLKRRNPKTLKVITLLDKKEGRKVEFVPDAIGFDIANEFVYGFGLDVKEQLRNRPFVGIFDQDKIDEL